MSEKILLIVDDDPNILKALKRLLRKEEYTLLMAESGQQALSILSENAVNVIISDHRMPVMTGVEFLSKVKQSYPDIIRIVLSGYSDIGTITQAINEGNIYKFISKPWDDEQIKTTIQEAFIQNELRMENSRLTEELMSANTQLIQKNAETSGFLEQVVNQNSDGIIIIDQHKKIIFSNPSAISLLIKYYNISPGDEFKLPYKENQKIIKHLNRQHNDDIVLEINCSPITQDGQHAFLISLHDISDLNRINIEKKRSEQRIKKVLLQIINAISQALEEHALHTVNHQSRVSGLAIAIGNKMKLDKEKLEGIRIAGLILDLGNHYIPNEILNHPVTISEDERIKLQLHTVEAYKILSNIDFPWPVAEIVLQHHENIDGSGYPNGLTDEQIRLESKIITVADVVTAMSEYRPHRPALSTTEIIDYIKQQKGKKFDPQIVDICIDLIETGNYL